MSTAPSPEKLPARVPSPSLTARLVPLVRRKPIDAVDRHEAAMFVLDTVASAVGGRTTPPGQTVGRWARRHGAAGLALDGFTGPPAILEGECGRFAGMCPDAVPEALLADPDAPWQVHQTSIKPWPSCRHTHPAIDAALALHAALDGAAVSAVEVATHRAAIDVCDQPEPQTEYSAKFFLQHCVAAALTDGAAEIYPAQADGRVRFPFGRLFIVAYRR